MKILHITAMSPLSPNSGIPAVLKQLTDAQNKLDRVKSIVLSLRGQVDQIDSPFFFYLGNQSVYSFVNKYKPDVAIIHSFFHIEYIEVARVLTKMNIPFFIEPHGSFGFQAMKKSRIKKKIANLTIFRQQIKGSIGYIFTNKAELEDAIYRTRNDIVIPNGVQPDIIRDSEGKNENSFKAPIFYYLGRFDIHHKGIDYLLDSLDILDQKGYKTEVRLYGTGTDEQIEFVNNRIKKFKSLDVNNYGTIYGDEKKRALEECNILILTSRYEGSPMTVLDGLSYGNPCVVTPGTNVADEIEDNKIGWKVKLDAESISKGILRAEKTYKINGIDYYNRCKEYVLDNYSWDKLAAYSAKEIKRVIYTHMRRDGGGI